MDEWIYHKRRLIKYNNNQKKTYSVYPQFLIAFRGTTGIFVDSLGYTVLSLDYIPNVHINRIKINRLSGKTLDREAEI